MSGKNNQKENISNNKDMDIHQFILQLECNFDYKIFREININYKVDKKGKKQKILNINIPILSIRERYKQLMLAGWKRYCKNTQPEI